MGEPLVGTVVNRPAPILRRARRLLASAGKSLRRLDPVVFRHRAGMRRRTRSAVPAHSRERALGEAIAWLLRSAEVGPESGSRCFRLGSGWSACYPEVTGYNLHTLFDHFHATGDRASFDRAVRMADWLLTVALSNGAYPGGYVDQPPKPVVFNTAQVLQGLVRTGRETGRAEYLAAARRAADWLVESQDPDGAWRRHCYLGVFRVTDTRIAYPLAEAWQATGDEKYRRAAVASLRYVVSRQLENGWFPDCDNSVRLVDQPNTHTIAYTVEGLLESGLILDEPEFLAAARRTSDALLRRFEIDRVLWGRYDARWRPTVSWSCLTGCAQTSKNWLRLYEKTGEPYYWNAALKMNDFLCACQDVDTPLAPIRGAIPGSNPLEGAYQPYAFPSWATKYFSDALLLERRLRIEAPSGVSVAPGASPKAENA